MANPLTTLYNAVPGSFHCSPFTMTGDYARDYHFRVVFFVNPLKGMSGGLSWDNIKSFAKSQTKQFLTQLTDTATLLYVSGLVKSVKVPSVHIEFDQWDLGGVTVPVPKKVSRDNVTVTFLDDSMCTVWNYWKGVQTALLDGLSMHILRPLCLSMLVTPELPEVSNYMGIPIRPAVPASPLLYPLLFPAEVNHTEFDKSSTQASVVTVTFVRFPEIVKVEDNTLYGRVSNNIKLLGKF